MEENNIMMVKAKILKAARVLATGMATAGSLALAGAAFAADGALEVVKLAWGPGPPGILRTRSKLASGAGSA